MNGRKNQMFRRNLLKSLVAGSPIVWSSPSVRSVILPAHAKTTEQQVVCSLMFEFEVEQDNVPAIAELTLWNNICGNADGEPTYFQELEFTEPGIYTTTINIGEGDWVYLIRGSGFQNSVVVVHISPCGCRDFDVNLFNFESGGLFDCFRVDANGNCTIPPL